MSDILCTVIGNRGHQVQRQSSRASGMTVCIQTQTERINIVARWDTDAKLWIVTAVKDSVHMRGATSVIDTQPLWTSSLVE